VRGEEEPLMAMASSSYLTVIFLWYREPSMGKDRAEEYMTYLEGILQVDALVLHAILNARL
jgi:hypothetical protein